MKRKLWFAFRIITVCFLMGCLTGSIIDTNYAANLEDEKEKQKEIQQQLKDTKSHLKELESLKGDAEAYIVAMDQKLNDLANSILEIDKSIIETQAQIEETKVQVADAQAEIEKQYEAMKLRIQYMYENGESSYLSMILDSESMAEFLNKAEYLSQITEYDRQQLERFEVAKADLDSKQAKLEAKEAELAASLAEIKAEIVASEELLAAKKQVVAVYKEDINETEKDVKNLAEDLETQKAIVAELEEIERKRKEEQNKNNLNKLNYDGGTMLWPISGRSYISSYFGTRPDPFGKPTQEFHSGIDIPAPYGTEILAAYDGQVAWSYYSSSAGNWVGIDHGNGIYTVYMHMSKRLVSEGDWVKKGQVIGKVGTTGRSTGNHLHFGVRKNGTYENPLKWVAP